MATTQEIPNVALPEHKARDLFVYNGLALSVRERLGEEKPTLAQALGVDPMPDAG